MTHSPIAAIQLPTFPLAQKLLTSFLKSCEGATEHTRISIAHELSDKWNTLTAAFPIPAIAQRSDFWYLIQLFALHRHIHHDTTPYVWNTSVSDTIYMPTSTQLYARLCELAKKPASQYTHVVLSRFMLDRLIELYGNVVVSEHNLSPSEWKVSPLPYDAMLRVSTIKQVSFQEHIFIDGYRFHPGLDTTSGLFGGSAKFGGAQYIDSIFLNQQMSIYPYLCIIRKNYGRQ